MAIEAEHARMASAACALYEQDFNKVEKERQEAVLRVERAKAALQTLMDAQVREIDEADKKGYDAGFEEAHMMYEKQVRDTEVGLYGPRFRAGMEYMHA